MVSLPDPVLVTPCHHNRSKTLLQKMSHSFQGLKPPKTHNSYRLLVCKQVLRECQTDLVDHESEDRKALGPRLSIHPLNRLYFAAVLSLSGGSASHLSSANSG